MCLLLFVIRLLGLLKGSKKRLGPQQRPRGRAPQFRHRLVVVTFWIIACLIDLHPPIRFLHLPPHSLLVGIQSRSITYDPYLLPFATTLLEFIPKDHLATTSLSRPKGNTCLHHLSRTFTRVGYSSLLLMTLLLVVSSSFFVFMFQAAFEARVSATTIDVHMRDS